MSLINTAIFSVLLDFILSALFYILYFPFMVAQAVGRLKNKKKNDCSKQANDGGLIREVYQALFIPVVAICALLLTYVGMDGVFRLLPTFLLIFFYPVFLRLLRRPFNFFARIVAKPFAALRKKGNIHRENCREMT